MHSPTRLSSPDLSTQARRSRAVVAATRGLVESLEARRLLAADAVLSDIPFTPAELTELGVEQITWNSQQRYAFDGQFVARFTGVSGTPSKQVKAIRALVDASSTVGALESVHGETIQVVQWLGADGLMLVQAPDNASPTAVANAMKRLGGFQYIEPNALVWATDRIPNDPNYGSLYGMGKIQAPKAWDITTGGLSSDLVVGVIDTGIDYTHPDLAANMWTNPGEIPGDGVDNDSNGYADDYYGYNFAGVRNSNPYDDNRHGTHVAGTIAAVGNNSRGVSGVNWSAKLMAIKFLNSGGSGSLADAAAAINYQASMVERGVKALISNNSWGGGGYDQSVKDAIDRYGAAGGLFVAAAGNDGVSSQFYPAAYTSNHIISVAASDENDNRAGFSNYGSSWVDIAAPGNNILSTVPGNGYTTLNGTSMATPHVVGAAALLWDIAGTSTPRSVIQNAVLQGVDALPQWNGLVGTGGRLNVWNSLNLIDLSWNVTSVTPDGSTVVTEPLLDFTVTLSADVLASSVAASDLLVNGIPADAFTINGPRSITFSYNQTPLQSSGQQTIEVAENAILRQLDNRGVDAFSSTFDFDQVALSVVDSTPANGTAVPAPVTQIDLVFNEGVDPSSLAIGDLLLSVGTVTNVEAIDANIIRFSVSGLEDESVGSVTMTLLEGRIADDFGFANSTWVGTFQLDNGTTGLGNTTPIGPASNLARSLPSANGIVSPAGESDEFTIHIDAGQQLSVLVDQVNSLHPAIEVIDESLNVIAYAAPDDVGQSAILQNLSIPSTGVYTVRIFGEQSTTGTYRVQAFLNATIEEEAHDLPSNGSRAGAQPLDGGMLPLATGRRAVVMGTAEVGGGTGATEYYSEGFDAPLGSEWTTYSSLAQGRVRTASTFGGYLSSSALVMDRVPGGPFNYNEAVLTLEVAGLANPKLQFAHADLGDEEHGIPAAYTGRANGDGVSISVDGVNWYRIWQPTNTPAGSWQHVEVNLATAAQAAGISLDGNLLVRFQQYDNLSLPADGRGYDAVKLIADAAAADWYRFDTSAGKSMTVALNAGPASALQVGLYDASGSLLTTGVASGDDARQLIENFTAPADGTYYLRVFGATSEEAYSLLVSEDLNLDVESNDDTATAQDIGSGGNALGWMAITDGPDVYRFNVASGDQLSITTFTPGDDVGLVSNSLDLRAELYAPDGSLVGGSANGAADGRNVQFTHVASVSGVYTLKLLPQAGQGNYVVAVSGNTGGPVPFSVTGIDPANESLPTSDVSNITIDFSHTVLASSLDASDLTIDGMPASGVTLVDKNTAVFTLTTAATTGTHLVSIAAGAVENLQGQPLGAFASSFRVDVTPPEVVSASVQPDDFLPVGDLTIAVQFSETIRAENLDNADFTLAAAGSGIVYPPGSFSYNPATSTLTLDYTQLPEDRYTLTIKAGDGAVEDLAGLDLPADYTVSFDLETEVESAPPLARRSPLGGLIFGSQKTSKIDFGSDTDTFTVSLDAGQTVSLVVAPDSGLAPIVELVDPSNNVIASATAPSAGGRAFIEAAAIGTTGLYRIVVRSDAGTTGGYTLQTTLNAIEEVESQNGTSNDSLASAEPIDASDFIVSGSVSRAAASGLAELGGSDYYSFEAGASSTVTVVLSGVDVSSLVLEVLDSTGALVTSGNAFAGEIGRAVENLSLAAAGTYYVRVGGESAARDLDYALVVSRNANINVEPNQNTATAQDLGQRGTVLGYQDALEGDDFYKVAVGQGDPLQITTSTPLDGALLPGNDLDVAVELYDESGVLVASATGGASDGRNVLLNHTAATGGVYVVRVVHQAGGGEYLLNVAGQAGGFLPLTVKSISPSNQAILRDIPGTITVSFSHALLASSVDASDLLVDGQPIATDVQFVEADTIAFSVPGLGEGPHTVEVAAGSVSNLDNTGNNIFNSAFRIDLTPPTVVESSISEGEFLGIGDLTYVVRFSEAINPGLLGTDDFTLQANTLGTTFTPDSFNYDPVSFELALAFSDLPEDAYTLRLASGDSGIEDLAGIDLDGDVNGSEGGDYLLNFALETISADFPTPLTVLQPAGAGLAEGSVSGKVDFAGDEDEYTLDVTAGSVVSVISTGTNGLQPLVRIIDSNGTVLASASATSVNGVASALSANVVVGGTIRIVITGVAGSTGTFSSRLILGATVEAESVGGPANDTPANAENLNGEFVSIDGTVVRASVVGQLGTATQDRFAVYSDGFETTAFSPLWTFNKSITNGRIARNLIYKASGTASLAMDVAPANGQFSRNEAVWTVNLAGLNSPRLRFSHADLGDEEHPMPATFNNTSNTDGVAVSPNGVNWYRVFTPGNLPAGQWQNYEIDLTQVANQYGFTLGSNFMVKFQQYDNLSLPSDGRGWDNVEITAAGTSDQYRVSLQASERLSVGVTGWGNGLVDLKIFNTNGDLLASGTSGSVLDSVIDSFVAPAAGDYIIRVAASLASAEQYSLLVQKGGTLSGYGIA